MADTPAASAALPASGRASWGLPAATAALLVAVGVVQLGFLSWHSLRNNEFLTVRTINLSYGEILRERPSRNHMPTYFLALKAWTEAFGRSEAALRLPSALACLGGILIVWRMGVRLLGPRVGLLVLAVCGLNQALAKMGAEARMYSWAFLGAALVAWAFVAYLDTGRGRYVLALALAGTAMLAVQALYTLVALAVVLYVWARRRTLAVRAWPVLVATLVPFAVLAPALVYLARAEGKIGLSHPWRRFELGTAIRNTGMLMIGDAERDWKALEVAGGVLVTACAVVLVGARVRRRREGASGQEGAGRAAAARPPVRYEGFLWLMVVVPVVTIPVLGLRSDARDPLAPHQRYLVTTLATTPLLIAAAYVALRDRGRRRLAVAYAAGFCGVVVASLAGFLSLPGTGMREVALHIGARLQPDDLVVAADLHGRALAFRHYGLPECQVIRPVDARARPTEFCRWLVARSAAAKRVWVVVHAGHPAKSPILKEMARQTGCFRPLGGLFAVGRTGTQLYECLGPRKEASEVPGPTKPESSVPIESVEED